MRGIGSAVCAVAALMLGGCGLQIFTEPKTNPVIEEGLGDIQVVATTAERRLAYVRKKEVEITKPDPVVIKTVYDALIAQENAKAKAIVNPGNVPKEMERERDDPNLIHLGRFGGKVGEYCAEPSPDAIESLAATFSLSASAALTGAGGAGSQDVKGEFARSLASTAAAMFRRTQGVQLYRDGAFFLCQGMMNGYLDAYEYRQALKYLRQDAIKVILKEFETKAWEQPVILMNPPSATELEAAMRKIADERVAKQKADEEAAAKKKMEADAAAKKKTEEEAAAKKQAKE